MDRKVNGLDENKKDNREERREAFLRLMADVLVDTAEVNGWDVAAPGDEF